jgi:hypothetical protein
VLVADVGAGRAFFCGDEGDKAHQRPILRDTISWNEETCLTRQIHNFVVGHSVILFGAQNP